VLRAWAFRLLCGIRNMRGSSGAALVSETADVVATDVVDGLEVASPSVTPSLIVLDTVGNPTKDTHDLTL
jgi:hypothetical protein